MNRQSQIHEAGPCSTQSMCREERTDTIVNSGLKCSTGLTSDGPCMMSDRLCCTQHVVSQAAHHWHTFHGATSAICVGQHSAADNPYVEGQLQRMRTAKVTSVASSCNETAHSNP